MSTKLLFKLFNSLFFVCFFIVSCTKTQDKAPVIKVGQRVWTFKEVQDYFQFRLQGSLSKGQQPKTLKKEFLNEIFLRSLVENWAKQNQIQSKKIVLTEEDKKIASKHSPWFKALKDHKSYLSLYNLFLDDLIKKTSDPSLKKQKSFYNQNKSRFIEPASCHLKQIVVKKEKWAQALQKRLKQGESFDIFHKLYSLKRNPGWIKEGELKIFDRICFNDNFKQTDSLSPVLKSPYGYHIFLVGKKKPRQQKTFKQVQNQIIHIFKTDQAKNQFQIWLKQEIFKTPLFADKNLLDTIHIQYKINEI